MNPAIDHPNRYSPQTQVGVVAYLIGSENPCPGTPTVTDYDGNVYNTIRIGDQCWMKQNLNSVRNAGGNSISRYCYANSNTNCELYGGLYQWATVMNGSGTSSTIPSGVQGICPTGWHVPSDGEWTQLTNYLISTYVDINSGNVGNKLKSCRQISSPLGGECATSDHPRWTNHATQFGTNDFGFTALPGGYIYNGTSYEIGNHTMFWTTTNNTSTTAWYRELVHDAGTVSRHYWPKQDYMGLRCLKN